MPSLCAQLMIALLLVPTMAMGQGEGADLEDSMNEAQDTLDSMTGFVGDVRFDEKDVKSLIELWPEFEALGETLSPDLGEDSDGAPDFSAVLNEPTYQSWIEKHGLDREDWLRRVMRIQLLIAREQFVAQSAEGNDQMQEQMKQLEEMRSQMGEEAYQQMVKAMDAASSMMQSMSRAMNDLPPASDEEQALLDKYRSQLLHIVGDDE